MQSETYGVGHEFEGPGAKIGVRASAHPRGKLDPDRRQEHRAIGRQIEFNQPHEQRVSPPACNDAQGCRQHIVR